VAQVGRERFIPFRIADIDGHPVLNLQLGDFQVTHFRDGVDCVETFTLEGKGGGLYCLTYTPLSAGQDYIELYDADPTIDIRIIDDEAIEDVDTGGVGTGNALVAYLTQDTSGVGALKGDLVAQPATFTLYVFKSQIWQSGDHNPLSAETSTQLDPAGNWLTSPLPVLRDTYHIVLLNNRGETHVIRPFLDLTAIISDLVTPVRVSYTGVSNETPSGACDGTSAVFTLVSVPAPGTEQVYLNGLLLEPGTGNDYLLVGNVLTMLYPPEANSKLRVYYGKPSQDLPAGSLEADIVVNTETPGGAVDGENTLFTTAFLYKPTTTRVFLNGIRLTSAGDYVEAGGHQISFVDPPHAGDILLIDYVVKP
jgi:hypothetical protein